ncbi:MAG: FlgD immunoglobulin-like domain containing protein [Armatimonadota bacterium]
MSKIRLQIGHLWLATMVLVAVCACTGQAANIIYEDQLGDPMMTLSNQFVKFAIESGQDSTGTWQLFTNNADPTNSFDNNKKIIDQALAMLYFDGQEDETDIFGDADGSVVIPYVNLDTQTAGFTRKVALPDGDDLAQYILVEYKATLVGNSLRWEYRFTNRANTSQRMGFHLLLEVDHDLEVGGDYYLPVADKREFPFNCVKLHGGEVPSRWFVSDIDKNDPTLNPAEFNFRPTLAYEQLLTDSRVTRPEYFMITSDETASEYGWDTVIEEARPENAGVKSLYDPFEDLSDSFGCNLLYSIQDLAPGGVRTVTGQINLTWAPTSLLDHLGVTLFTPSWWSYQNGNISANPIDVRAYISNATSYLHPQVNVSISCGKGLILKPGQPDNYTMSADPLTDLLVPNTNNSYSWQLIATGEASGAIPVTVRAQFTPGGSTTTTSYINVPAITQHTYSNQSTQDLLYLTGFPFTFTDPDPTVALGLGPWVQLAAYDTVSKSYKYATDGGVSLEPGRGYWLKVSADTTVTLNGPTPVDQKAAYRVQLSKGWNLISNPYQYGVEIGLIHVTYGQNDYTWAQAIDKGYIRPEIWLYNTSIGTYDIPLSRNVDMMQPYQGFWLYAKDTLTIAYQPNPLLPVMNPEMPMARTLKRAAGSLNDWRVNLLVDAGGVKDVINTFGIAPDAQDGPSKGDMMKPPMSPSGLSAYFPRTTWGDASGNYAVDLQAPGTEKSWSFEVHCTQMNRWVSISWPDLTQLPAKLPLVLTDETTGAKVAMRSVPSIGFNSGDGGVHKFTITAGGAFERLQFTQAGASASRIRQGATITYGLTMSAQVTLKVRNITGRLLYTATPGRSTAGLSTMQWGGQDQQGRLLPPGIYLCELSAEGQDQQRVHASFTIRTK